MGIKIRRAKRRRAIKNKAKKRQVAVLIGEWQDIMIDLFSELLKAETKDKYDLKINSAFYGEELLELAENGAFDIFIVTLNNIRFRPDYSNQERLKKTLQLITQIKTRYKTPVIALSSLPKELARAKLVADFILPRPFKIVAFRKVIKKCLARP